MKITFDNVFREKKYKEKDEKTNYPFLLSRMTTTIQELGKEVQKITFYKTFIYSGLCLSTECTMLIRSPEEKSFMNSKKHI